MWRTETDGWEAGWGFVHGRRACLPTCDLICRPDAGKPGRPDDGFRPPASVPVPGRWSNFDPLDHWSNIVPLTTGQLFPLRPLVTLRLDRWSNFGCGLRSTNFDRRSNFGCGLRSSDFDRWSNFGFGLRSTNFDRWSNFTNLTAGQTLDVRPVECSLLTALFDRLLVKQAF